MMRDFKPGDRVHFDWEGSGSTEGQFLRGEGIVVLRLAGPLYEVQPDWDTVEQDFRGDDLSRQIRTRTGHDFTGQVAMGQVAMFYRWELSEVDDA